MLYLALAQPPGFCAMPRACRYVPCTPLATIIAEATGSAVLAIVWLKNPARPAAAATGPSATGSHIILLPKLALSCSK